MDSSVKFDQQAFESFRNDLNEKMQSVMTCLSDIHNTYDKLCNLGTYVWVGPAQETLSGFVSDLDTTITKIMSKNSNINNFLLQVENDYSKM